MGVRILLDGLRPQWRPSLDGWLGLAFVSSALELYQLAVAESYLNAVDACALRGLVSRFERAEWTEPIAQSAAALRTQLVRMAPELLRELPSIVANPSVFDPMTM